MKEQFYPNWLKKQIIINKKNQVKKLGILSIIFISISFVNIYRELNEIDEYKKQCEESNNVTIGITSRDLNAIDNFNAIYNILSNKKQIIKSITISKDTIDLEVYAKTLKEYSGIMKILEESFVIEEVSTLKYEEEKGYFQVRMKKNESI